MSSGQEETVSKYEKERRIYEEVFAEEANPPA
jgi:hypothetical protein